MIQVGVIAEITTEVAELVVTVVIQLLPAVVTGLVVVPHLEVTEATPDTVVAAVTVEAVEEEVVVTVEEAVPVTMVTIAMVATDVVAEAIMGKCLLSESFM